MRYTNASDKRRDESRQNRADAATVSYSTVLYSHKKIRRIHPGVSKKRDKIFSRGTLMHGSLLRYYVPHEEKLNLGARRWSNRPFTNEDACVYAYTLYTCSASRRAQCPPALNATQTTPLSLSFFLVHLHSSLDRAHLYIRAEPPCTCPRSTLLWTRAPGPGLGESVVAAGGSVLKRRALAGRANWRSPLLSARLSSMAAGCFAGACATTHCSNARIAPRALASGYTREMGAARLDEERPAEPSARFLRPALGLTKRSRFGPPRLTICIYVLHRPGGSRKRASPPLFV